ncbi:MAG: HAD-IA family hydrolase [Andreesenia angusta]|nr:HAD-IA family hydrolase [Andreesenia angusta]
MKKKYIFFDLDGTIVDSREGIVNSVEYALKKFQIDVDDRMDLCKFIGPPLRESFKYYYNMNDREVERAVNAYRENYSVKGIFENKIYDGIEEMLDNLRREGLNLVLATSKPYIYANQILDYLNLKKYFSFVSGSKMNGKEDKAEVISYAMESLNIDNPSKILMVGDRKYDILGAKKIGIESIAVLYGFGNIDEFEEYGADHIISNVEELENMIIDISI